MGVLAALVAVNSLFFAGYLWNIPEGFVLFFDLHTISGFVFHISITLAWTSVLARIFLFYLRVFLVLQYRSGFAKVESRPRKQLRRPAIVLEKLIRRNEELAYGFAFSIVFGVAFLSPVSFLIFLIVSWMGYCAIGILVFSVRFRLSYRGAATALTGRGGNLKAVSPNRVRDARISVSVLVVCMLSFLCGIMKYVENSNEYVKVFTSSDLFEAALIAYSEAGVILVLPQNGEYGDRQFLVLPLSSIVKITNGAK